MGNKVSTEASIRDIKRKTRKKYSAEEKIRIVLEGLVPGSRSGLIRAVWRAGLRQLDGQAFSRWEPVDIEEMRCIVAEELARALAGRQVAGDAVEPHAEDIEAKYGAKLDRMLGGLAAGRADKGDG